MNVSSGNWFSKSFKEFDDITEFLNQVKVNINPEHISWVNNRYYVLFLVDANAKVKVKRKSKRKAK